MSIMTGGMMTIAECAPIQRVPPTTHRSTSVRMVPDAARDCILNDFDGCDALYYEEDTVLPPGAAAAPVPHAFSKKA